MSFNLRRLGLSGQTLKKLCATLMSTKASTRHRKSTQMHAMPSQTESQANKH